MTDADKEFQQCFPLIAAGLRSDDLGNLRSQLGACHLAPGEPLLAEGKPSDAAYLVRSGALAVNLDVDGVPVEVGRIGAGAVVGEVSFLDGGPASASVVAAEPTELYRLSRDEFERLRATHPGAATAVLRGLCRTLASRVRSANRRLEDLRGVTAAPNSGSGGFLDALRRLFGM